MKTIDKDHQPSRTMGKWLIVEAIVVVVLGIAALLYRHSIQH